MKIQEILKGDNHCTRLLDRYRAKHGVRMKIREKPWWFPCKRATTNTPGRIWWSPTRTYTHPNEALSTVAHEIQHDIDTYSHGLIKWVLLYTFPQNLALLGLCGFLGFAHPIGFAFFLFFVFGAPWPAPGRLDAEARGYAVSTYVRMRLQLWLPDYAPLLVKLTPYYYASWSKERVQTTIQSYVLGKTEVMELVDDVLSEDQNSVCKADTNRS